MLDPSSEIFGDGWFVYLFALTDCSAFKVGFSCNPLQRIYTFSRRYFEHFDLRQSLLLRFGGEREARDAEALLKTQLAACRTECPCWVPVEAGGRTEWFSAVNFVDAQATLNVVAQAEDCAPATNAFDPMRIQLERFSAAFEQWAWKQAHALTAAWSAANSGYVVRDCADQLRDWLDAYRYFDLPLFKDDPDVYRFVSACAHRGG